jgi:hypothetical protein
MCVAAAGAARQEDEEAGERRPKGTEILGAPFRRCDGAHDPQRRPRLKVCFGVPK